MHYIFSMFNDNAHSEIWLTLQRLLKRGDNDSAMQLWHKALPSLAAQHDDLRMLYYVGRHGQRDAYHYACTTVAYLKDSPPEILRARLAIFRYAVEQPMAGHESVAQWMMADLASTLGMALTDFPPPNPEMPEAIASVIAQHRAKAKHNHS